MKNILFKRVDNSPLILFRIIFGFLIAAEAWGAIATGWIKRTLIEPEFTFSFIGFDFLQPLPGDWMYAYYIIMGLTGLFVMIGYKYRLNIILYTVMWTAVYLMQKTSYNNHYYLLILLLIFMSIVPAHRYKSVDVKLNPKLKCHHMPNWVIIFIIAQLWIVYTYASVAKIYPDWLDATVPKLLMQGKSHFYLVGELLQQSWIHYSIAYFGILFDLLIVPALLWKKTRNLAFFISVFFHLFNSFIFHIGIFPYMSLAFTLFFYPKEFINRKFLKSKPFYDKADVVAPNYHKSLTGFIIIWLCIQFALPLRHWFIEGDVLWTEEGHRMSWRMMLRTKSSSTLIKIVNPDNNKTFYVQKKDYLTKKQQRMLAKPDGVWQFCQRLKEEYQSKGDDIEIYVRSRVSVNGKPYKPLIDPKQNMAQAKWDYFFHNDWVLLHKD
ncbi:HTTM domain-containing protein [Mesohalobacter halotolerans]|uniref:HTTM domain-containing protein n=1 Tax=Mesohalobacter halotolerans TaxID=1883405 RepID=A0A4V6ALC8_9FLAO|nr:HTTM domain-containing protein [Mesohalobacter halotolerans]TKS56195.1 HTTM domain-containing protein [Mesohalobacter halotolerans]